MLGVFFVIGFSNFGDFAPLTNGPAGILVWLSQRLFNILEYVGKLTCCTPQWYMIQTVRTDCVVVHHKNLKYTYGLQSQMLNRYNKPYKWVVATKAENNHILFVKPYLKMSRCSYNPMLWNRIHSISRNTNSLLLYLFLVISQRRVVIWYPYFSQCCSTDPIAPVLVKNIGKKTDRYQTKTKQDEVDFIR